MILKTCELVSTTLYSTALRNLGIEKWSSDNISSNCILTVQHARRVISLPCARVRAYLPILSFNLPTGHEDVEEAQVEQ